MAAVHHLGFFECWNFIGWWGLEGRDAYHLPNFIKIGRTIFEISWFFKMAAVRHLGLFGAYLDHPRRVLGGLFLVQNLVVIDAVVSILWTFWYLACLAWKCSFCIIVFGRLNPLIMMQYQWNPRFYTLAWVRVVWAIKRENPPTCVTCRWVPEKVWISKKLLYFTHLPRSLTWADLQQILIQNRSTVAVADLITCAKFIGDRLRGSILRGSILKNPIFRWQSQSPLILCCRAATSQQVISTVLPDGCIIISRVSSSVTVLLKYHCLPLLIK